MRLSAHEITRLLGGERGELAELCWKAGNLLPEVVLDPDADCGSFKIHMDDGFTVCVEVSSYTVVRRG